MRIERQVAVTNEYGLHIRVATRIVQEAKAFVSEITLAKNGNRADAKSIFQVLQLGAEMGAMLSVETDGDDAEAAMNAIVEILTEDPHAQASPAAGSESGTTDGN